MKERKMIKLIGMLFVAAILTTSCAGRALCPTYDGLQKKHKRKSHHTSWVINKYDDCKPPKNNR